MIRYATLAQADSALSLWDGESESLRHLGDSGNSVYRYTNYAGAPRILRFTDPEFRSRSELEGEIDFLRHLQRENVSVSAVIPSRHGRWIEEFRTKSGPLLAWATTFAPGLRVDEFSVHWGRDYLFAWGRHMAEIHQAAIRYQSGAGARWHWNEELFFRLSHELLKEDAVSRDELSFLMREIEKLPKNSANYGMIHADHHFQNFNFNPVTSSIEAFDFGNCCYHWFLADVAITLSTLRKKPDRENLRAWLLEGYASVLPLPAGLDEQIELFIRLRVVYVYLSRLYMFGKNPNEAQKETLRAMKEAVHLRRGWRDPLTSRA